MLQLIQINKTNLQTPNIASEYFKIPVVNFVNILCAHFYTKVFWAAFSLEKSCRKDFCTKNGHVICWWNWRLEGSAIRAFENLRYNDGESWYLESVTFFSFLNSDFPWFESKNSCLKTKALNQTHSFVALCLYFSNQALKSLKQLFYKHTLSFFCWMLLKIKPKNSQNNFFDTKICHITKRPTPLFGSEKCQKSIQWPMYKI